MAALFIFVIHLNPSLLIILNSELMERKRQTEAGISVESRIQSGQTHFFELSQEDQAYEKAREIKSYVYPCFEELEKETFSKIAKRDIKTKRTEMVGYCVPV